MFSFIGALLSTSKWNADPNQQKLASMILIAAVEGASIDFGAVQNLKRTAGWSGKEEADRVLHPVSMLRPMTDTATFAEAKRIAESMYYPFLGRFPPSFR